jgi:hypothetical protein
MKPTTSLPTAREFAGTDGSRPVRQTLCWTLAGVGLGVVAACAYLFLGGEYLFSIPRRDAIVFYPGFLAGFKVAEWGLSVTASKAVGVLAVGLAYALIPLLLRFVWRSGWRSFTPFKPNETLPRIPAP